MAQSHTGRKEWRLLCDSFSPVPSSFPLTLSHPEGAWLAAVLLCWDAPRVAPLLLLVHSCLHVALLPGNPCWAQLLEQGQSTELLAWLHPHLFSLAVPFASGRLPIQKRQVGKAKLEGECATSVIVSPTPALMMVHRRDDPTVMVHREMTGQAFYVHHCDLVWIIV